MEKFTLSYSAKNIPVPSNIEYKLKLLETTGYFLNNARWKAYFFINPPQKRKQKETYGFRSTRLPETVVQLRPFENELLQVIEQLEFRETRSDLQTKMKNDLKRIRESKNIIVPADKTVNYYSVPKEQYQELLENNITTEYRKADENIQQEMDQKSKQITDQLDISDRVDVLAPKGAYVTFKDHKRNFRDRPTCRLINPCPSEVAKISKKILDRINIDVREAIQVNQWRNTQSVIEWFKGLQPKENTTFLNFDICSFYPNISKTLLQSAINFAKEHTTISQLEENIIFQAKNSLLFKDGTPWQKKNSADPFDVTMGSADGAETCELVGLYLLNQISTIIPSHDVGIYRDDGLAVIHKSPKETEDLKKKLCKKFKDLGLEISAEANIKTVDFLDVTFDLKTKVYKPYTKPDNKHLYVHRMSNHPPSVTKHIPQSIESRLSNISSNEDIFNNSKEEYERALKESGYDVKLAYKPTQPTINNQRRRKRHVLWYNPPWSSHVKTNIAKKFLQLVTKHFPANHPLHKIFNRNTLKVSYCCMPNMATIIKRHNNKILKPPAEKTEPRCNCRKSNKQSCPLPGGCTIDNIVYEAKLVTEAGAKEYIGLTSNPFKTRYSHHKSSFQHRNLYQTALSREVWKLKDNGTPYTISWSVKKQLPTYSPQSKKCPLCLWEKLQICEADKATRLNKRSELVSNCLHRKRFLLSENG